jgi:hypothetical protein
LSKSAHRALREDAIAQRIRSTWEVHLSTATAERGVVRQAGWQMSADDTLEFIKSCLVTRAGTVGPDGWPYVVPELFVYDENCIWLHQTAAKGHLRTNLEFSPKVCLEFDEHGDFWPYGTAQCDTVLSYRSAVAFGSATIIDDARDDIKVDYFEKLMAKYAGASWGREQHTFPRTNLTAVYKIALEIVTGKHQAENVTLKRWDAPEGTTGGPGTRCPFG